MSRRLSDVCFTPKGDMVWRDRDVRFVPQVDINGRANASGGVDLNYWRGGRPSKAGTPSAMRWKG